MTIKYKGAFKKDTREYDGLDAEDVRKGIIVNPLQRVYAVVALDVAQVVNQVDQGGSLVPQMKIVHIEPQNGDNLIVVREMLDSSFRARTGNGAQASLFDQDDPQANEDAVHVGDILNGALPFIEPTAAGESTVDGAAADKPDEPEGDAKPRRGRK